LKAIEMKCSTAVFAYPFWEPMNWAPADALNRLSEVNVYFIDLTKRLKAVTRGQEQNLLFGRIYLHGMMPCSTSCECGRRTMSFTFSAAKRWKTKEAS